MSVFDLVDVNVWLALANIKHPHHMAARTYWATAAVPLAFCRTSMQGFLRLLTQKSVMGDAVHTPLEAWSIYAAHRANSRTVFLEEPAGIEAHWQSLSTAANFHRRDWTDAYLASFALSSNSRLVSFDAGFAQYQGLDFLHLTTSLAIAP